MRFRDGQAAARLHARSARDARARARPASQGARARRSRARARAATRGASPAALRKFGGHGASGRPAALSRAASSSRPSSEPAVLVDRRRRVAALAQARRDRVEPQLRGVDVVDLVPVERAGHARVGHGAHRVGGGDRAVARVLVVVDEDADALLLPPACWSRVPASAARPRARARPRRGARRRSRAAGWMRTLTWMPREPEVFGKPVSPCSASTSRTPCGDGADLVEADLRRRVEVDAQLVGMVEVAAAHRPRVPVDHAEVDAPGEVRARRRRRARARCARWGSGPSRSAATPARCRGRASGRRTRRATPSTQRLSVVGRSRRWRTTASSHSR